MLYHPTSRKPITNLRHLLQIRVQQELSNRQNVSIPLSTISNTTRPVVTRKMKTQISLPDVESGKTRKATHQPADDKKKASSRKLKNNQSDHKTTQVVIIITVIFFLLWLPNIVIDQIPTDQLTRILLETHKGSFIIYFFYQIKYISHNHQCICVYIHISAI